MDRPSDRYDRTYGEYRGRHRIKILREASCSKLLEDTRSFTDATRHRIRRYPGWKPFPSETRARIFKPTPEKIRDSCRHNRDDRRSCRMTMDHRVQVYHDLRSLALLPWLVDYRLPGVIRHERSPIPRGPAARPRRRWTADCHR